MPFEASGFDLERARKDIFNAEQVNRIQIKKIFEKNADHFLAHTQKKNKVFNSDSFIRNLQTLCGGINILDQEYETSNGGNTVRQQDRSPAKSSSFGPKYTMKD